MLSYRSKVYVRKTKTNKIEITYRFCGKTVEKFLVDEKEAYKYAWQVARENHAKLINLVDHTIEYY